jgi:hypothetical protein
MDALTNTKVQNPRVPGISGPRSIEKEAVNPTLTTTALSSNQQHGILTLPKTVSQFCHPFQWQFGFRMPWLDASLILDFDRDLTSGEPCADCFDFDAMT